MYQKITIFLLRVALGWYMFYAGITKIIDPDWSAAGYLVHAKIFSTFYLFLTTPMMLPTVNFINEWGLTLLGVSLILGALVKYSAPLGALLMLLYYLPLGIIHPDAHTMIVDDHIIFALLLIYFYQIGAGKYFGLDSKLSRN